MTREEVIKEIDASKYWDDITNTLDDDDYFCNPGVQPRKWELNEDGEESIIELYAVDYYLYITIQVGDYYTELEVPYSELMIGHEAPDHQYCSPDIVGFRSTNGFKDFFIKLRDAEEDTEEDAQRLRISKLERKVKELEEKLERMDREAKHHQALPTANAVEELKKKVELLENKFEINGEGFYFRTIVNGKEKECAVKADKSWSVEPFEGK
jgi:predicted ribosome quality control (RQC) complex YloA/Tae2 family protein